jgi:hypothetical protein
MLVYIALYGARITTDINTILWCKDYYRYQYDIISITFELILSLI